MPLYTVNDATRKMPSEFTLVTESLLKLVFSSVDRVASESGMVENVGNPPKSVFLLLLFYILHFQDSAAALTAEKVT